MEVVIVILGILLVISITFNIILVRKKPKVILTRDKEMRTMLNNLEVEIKKSRDKYGLNK